MIEITTICPYCDKKKELSFDDDFRGDDFPEEMQPWWVPCAPCDGFHSDSVGVFQMVEDVLRTAQGDNYSWVGRMDEADKYYLGELPEESTLTDVEIRRIWRDFAAYTHNELNMVLWFRPGVFLHIAEVARDQYLFSSLWRQAPGTYVRGGCTMLADFTSGCWRHFYSFFLEPTLVRNSCKQATLASHTAMLDVFLRQEGRMHEVKRDEGNFDKRFFHFYSINTAVLEYSK